jgi:exosome complex component RRP4
MAERKIVVPGETIIKGEEFLPGNGTRREGDEIVASRYGLADISDRFIKIIPLSGVYFPRKGNSIIAQVTDINQNGWVLEFGGILSGYLPLTEVPKFINKDEMRDFLDFGDLIFGKIVDIGRSVTLSIKLRGYSKLKGGMIININPNKVPF